MILFEGGLDSSFIHKIFVLLKNVENLLLLCTIIVTYLIFTFVDLFLKALIEIALQYIIRLAFQDQDVEVSIKKQEG